MRITTRISWSIDTGEIIEHDSYDYSGPIELACGGPSTQQKDIAADQQSFYKTLQSSFSSNFAGQTNILKSLTASFAPILQAGINQYGFSAAQDSALRSQTTSGVANHYQAAQRATQQRLATVGGGNQFLPTGAAAQLTQQNAVEAANTQSNEQLGITEAGYQQGRQNYLSAANELGGVAQQYNPQGYAGSANEAGKSAFESATTNQELQAQADAQLGGMIGGLAGTGLGMAIGGPAGAKLGGSLGGSLGSGIGGMF